MGCKFADNKHPKVQLLEYHTRLDNMPCFISCCSEQLANAKGTHTRCVPSLDASHGVLWDV